MPCDDKPVMGRAVPMENLDRNNLNLAIVDDNRFVIPKINSEAGPVSRYFTKRKLNSLIELSAAQAQILANQNSALKSTLEAMELTMTFSSRVQLSFAEMDHQKNMMDIEEKKAKAELQKIQMENLLVQNEVKLSDLDIQARIRAMEEDG